MVVISINKRSDVIFVPAPLLVIGRYYEQLVDVAFLRNPLKLSQTVAQYHSYYLQTREMHAFQCHATASACTGYYSMS